MNISLNQIITPEGAFLIGLICIIYLYIRILRRKSAKTRIELSTSPDEIPQSSMTETELDRYSRHILLREIGGQGQSKLRKAKVLVVGAGGLGSPILSYLAAAGVGTIGVIDDDLVSLSNLQRQVLFDEDHLDYPKVFAAKDKIKKLNPFIDILPFNRRLTTLEAELLFIEFDLIVDGSDNFSTRQVVNLACVKLNKPLVSGAISQWEGQVSIFNETKNSACYACIFPIEPADGLAPNCAEGGVMGALPGIIGSVMASEVIKKITGAGVNLTNKLMIFDALNNEFSKINIKKNINCKICKEHYET
ncbi:HesA/MoeB/ThiF family protein [Amylibacter sp.]|jgi:molybdopterin/thiamine biosynthesis adenylyltransferase|nr:HesA/MoeB/ThiF family protein [Amylibacter sp.]MDA9293856.1 HesA/MoeB/ThiF family protein [Amylibacter sp.]MDA9313524.1 HesA/MoeB/ThiF family protein [Amylibacter sp.]MDB0015481.1 HesA/MoeB/ThiF family protein [Amylibacter sp.]MDB4117024.1 HesA/MoeB/ThiF family protein [Amylibacter sp.]|tara:strand:+ start:59915 stop:60829 length:915 start_codon:yes stop_codon:yes gene_type:complete